MFLVDRGIVINFEDFIWAKGVLIFQVEDHFKHCLAVFEAWGAALVHFVEAEGLLAAFAERSAELSEFLRLKTNHKGFNSEYCFTMILKTGGFLAENVFKIGKSLGFKKGRL